MRLLGMGVGGLALEQVIPLGRVWSFPKKIVLATRIPPSYYDPEALDNLRHEPKIGTTIRVRIPQRFILKRDILDFSKPPQWREEIYWGRPPG